MNSPHIRASRHQVDGSRRPAREARQILAAIKPYGRLSKP
jgi:hypothetical protein